MLKDDGGLPTRWHHRVGFRQGGHRHEEESHETALAEYRVSPGEAGSGEPIAPSREGGGPSGGVARRGARRGVRGCDGDARGGPRATVRPAANVAYRTGGVPVRLRPGSARLGRT